MISYTLGQNCSIVCRESAELKIVEVQLQCLGQRPEAGTAFEKILQLLERYCQGEDVALPVDVLDLSGLTDFSRRVLLTLREVARGTVVSYARLAELCGCPEGARAVGNVLRHNPFPLFFPCHRVVKKDGAIGGFMGDTGQCVAVELKLRLLQNEGVYFRSNANQSVPAIPKAQAVRKLAAGEIIHSHAPSPAPNDTITSRKR